MKVVALVSGGKDSCYAMMRCIDFGHQIVALANLMPADDSVDELDSYMYQTVGHQLVASYAECMGLPLFRRRIRGSTRHQGLNYKTTPGDEVEDMFLLLREVKQQIPSVSAVCSGAIASDYQRLRVESVCSRLGLVSFAYLWKQDQTVLLEDMIRRGIVAKTIKVAAMGLEPAKHLGRELAELFSYLIHMKELYGLNVCGEGGEYESLTLDCPLFENARIILDEFQVILHSPDTIASVGILHPLAFHLEPKKELLSSSNYSGQNSSVKQGHVHEVQGDFVPNATTEREDTSLESNTLADTKLRLSVSRNRTDVFSMSCWVQNDSTASGRGSIQEDLRDVLRQIEIQLHKDGFDWLDVLYIHLYISSMKDFAVANDVYVRFITEKKCLLGVPSRSTIELPLLQVGLGNSYVEILVANDRSKKVLHVQSISCWAPSCIGPYSQATLHKELLYMAGQLGLDPPTMMISSGGAAIEMKQALVNAEAIANSFGVYLSSSTVLWVIYCAASLDFKERAEIQQSLKGFSSEAPDSQNIKRVPHPVSLYILAPALPKGALVEVKPVLQILENEQDEVGANLPQPSRSIAGNIWNIQEKEWHRSCYSTCVSGNICSALASITENAIADISLETDRTITSGYSIRAIAKFCIFIVEKILSENNFLWVDLLHLKVYYSTKLSLTADIIQLAFDEAFSEFFKVNENIESGRVPICSLLPVLSSGRSPTMEDIITCELLASKLH